MNRESLKSLGLIASLMFAASMATIAAMPWIRAEPLPAPTPVVVTVDAPAPIVPIASEPALVIVTDAAGKRIESAEVEAVAAKLAVGTWIVHAIPKPGDTGWTRSVVVSEGVKPAPPPVVPPVIPPPVDPPKPPELKATAATFIFEKDQHAIPGPVLAALDKLNRDRGIIATTFDQDTKDGTGDVPEQYKPQLAAAQAVGLPALVVMAGKEVLRVVKDPKTLEVVMEAVP